jgi:hypothetical protein
VITKLLSTIKKPSTTQLSQQQTWKKTIVLIICLCLYAGMKERCPSSDLLNDMSQVQPTKYPLPFGRILMESVHRRNVKPYPVSKSALSQDETAIR